MQQLSIVLSKIHCYVETRSLDYIIWIRLLLGLVFFEILCEHLLDAEFIAIVSRIHAITSTEVSGLQRTLAGYIMSSGTTYGVFLVFGLILTALYVSGIANLSVVWLLVGVEWIFQVINVRNLYGHEYVIHNFLMLLCLIEIGQGRLKLNRFFKAHWQPSAVSGLAVLLIKFQFLVVYFMAGLAKVLSSDWSNYDVLDKVFLNTRYSPSFFDFVLIDYKEITPYLIFAIKAFLMCFPMAIMSKRLQKPAVAAGIFFHLTMAVKVGLYGFGFMMVSLYLLFFHRPVIKS